MTLMRKGKSSFFVACACIAAGMGGELHIYIPALGTIAMLDLVSYCVALPIICANWGRMGKYMRRSLCWAFAWMGAAMLANLLNFVNFRYWAKCVTIASSSWAIMAAAYLLLKNYPRGYLWYLVGTGIGGWISLYYFRNGSLEGFATQGEVGAYAGLDNLMEKQIYPNIARGILYGSVLPLFLWCAKFPVFGVLVATMVGGFWLLFHGGSRSSFGIFCAAAGAGFMVSYGAKAFKRMARHPTIMVALAGLALAVLFGGYKMMAKTGTLGEGERAKFESEFGVEGRGAIEGRAGLGHAVTDAVESWWIGKGWHLRNHSVMTNALACEGVVGFLFWVYFYLQVLWWVSKRMPYSGNNVTFIALMILSACWDVFGSPFGTRHKFFMLMTFIALCRDNPYYGVGTIFEHSMPISGRGLARRW